MANSSIGPYQAVPYHAVPDHALNKYHVVWSDEAASVLGHDPTTKDAAEFLAAHMNHAYHRGRIAGGSERSRQMRALLELER